MDSSPVLRQQSKNKIHSDFLRMKNEHNKMAVRPNPSKLLSAPHLSSPDVENKDPGNSEISRKVPVRSGVSRLPVLAKSLRLQTPSDFGQSHCRWEEKPLAGKAKKKKPCTRPIPFNLSQPKSLRVATENQQPLTVLQSRTGTGNFQHDNDVHKAHLKTQNINAKPTKHQAMLNSNADSSKGTGKSNGKATEKTSQRSGESGAWATLSHSISSIPNHSMHQNSTTSSAEAALNAEACLDNMNLLSLKDPTKTSHASQKMQLTAQGNFSKSSTVSSVSDKGENFQPDHAALLSILRNEGVSATGLGSATPQSKPYNYLPQRVSVMKSRQKAGATTGSMKSVRFSPDSAALQSILQNEGVKIGGSLGATPQNSERPSGRGTSIYTAQRVPVRKNRVEASGGPVVALKETPQNKWTPQRVRDTRNQPMSSMKWHLSTQQSPYAGTPRLVSCKTNLQPRQEEVVQRLFDDQEDEQSTKVTDKDPETQAEQLSTVVTTTKSYCEEKIQTNRADSNEDEELAVGGQPFFQSMQRESVIFFSTGKKLLRAPRFEHQESSAHQEQHDEVSSEERKVLPAHEETSSVSGPTCQIKPSVQSLHRDLIVQKTSALSSPVAMLRKRLPPLEELRMDEEVATYTSMSVSAAPGFLPHRPRCGNPLASILHFEESSRFVPIGSDLSSAPSSPQSSPMQER